MKTKFLQVLYKLGGTRLLVLVFTAMGIMFSLAIFVDPDAGFSLFKQSPNLGSYNPIGADTFDLSGNIDELQNADNLGENAMETAVADADYSRKASKTSPSYSPRESTETDSYANSMAQQSLISKTQDLASHSSIHKPDEPLITRDQALLSNKRLIPVHISGAVHNPNVYLIAENSYLLELINMAGGLTDDAYIKHLNLAEELLSNTKYYIPISEADYRQNVDAESKSDDNYWNQGAGGNSLSSNLTADNLKMKSKHTINETQSSFTRVNINLAGVEELITIPGIGPQMARTIINYRNQIGQFKTVKQIMEVKGIKASKFKKIVNHICI